jgi:transposase-like protein
VHEGVLPMAVADVFYAFQTQDQAVQYLEEVRWRGHPLCPYCQSDRVCRHVSGDRKGPRWQCQQCSRAFAVTVGTIFHRTHVPLRQWFLVLAWSFNQAAPSINQLARDLGMRRATVGSMLRRLHAALEKEPEQAALLSGLVRTAAARDATKRRATKRRATKLKHAKEGRPA